MDREPAQVVVVDDEPMVCGYLSDLINTAGDLHVVATAHDGAAAVECVIRYRPHLVLMDLRMPGVDGLTAIERVCALRDPPPIVALTMFDADHDILRALRAGATGYLLKTVPPRDLIELVRAAVLGHTVLSSAARDRLLDGASGRRAARDSALARLAELTARETQVLACLGEGLSNAQIAARLRVTEGTVKNHISRVLLKLGCTNRTQAGLLAHAADLARAPGDVRA
ncbi:response regulator transcription factor [Spirillospora sp. NBC_00431]